MFSLDVAIKSEAIGDYVYTYPLRQAYRRLPLNFEELKRHIIQSIKARTNASLYVHIPFCKQICRFCNLYTTPVPTMDDSWGRHYVERILREAHWMRDSGFFNNLKWTTLYLGGGSPNALPVAELEFLISTLRDLLDITDDVEIGIELAPELCTSEQLTLLRKLGFSRIAIHENRAG